MRVAVVCREHPIHFNGGFSIAAWNTARAAVESGVEIVYITSQRPDGFCNAEMIAGVKVVWMAGTNHRDYPSFHRVLAGAFPTYHKQHTFDLIHGHGYSAAPLAKDRSHMLPIIFQDHGSKESYVQSFLSECVLTQKLTATPASVLGNHNDVYFGSPYPAGECDFKHMRRYDRVLATSLCSLVDFRTRYFLPNVELFYHCIYDLPDTSKVVRNGRTVALFSGDLDSPWKAGTSALRLLEPLKDEIDLLLIGGGKSVPELAKLKFPRVRFTGHLPEKDAMTALASADVLFESSIHHMGTNLCGISALGLGVPIVGFPTGGHYDLVGDREDQAGVLVDPTNSDSFVEAIRRVLKYKEIFRDSAWKMFRWRFSPSVCSAAIWNVYRRIAK